MKLPIAGGTMTTHLRQSNGERAEPAVETFVVRAWRGKHGWEGEVELLDSGRVIPFRSLLHLYRLLECTILPDRPPRP